jgi:hypothetical protein
MINSFPDPYIKTNKKLNRNPLYRFLFRCGYVGTEDLYEYWIKNQTKILRLYKEKVDKKSFDKDTTEFKHKVIWSTYLGIFLRFEIKKYLRLSTNIKTNFSHIKTVYGDQLLTIVDFNDTYNKMENTSKTDLRGTALIKANFKNLEVYNVDFNYASLDGCTFENVTFSNCSFNYTSFTGSKIIDSTFNKECTFIKSTFYNTVIKSKFHCNIVDVDIIPMRQKIITNRRMIYNIKYPSYTLILSHSFAIKSNDKLIYKQYEKQKKYDTLDIKKYAQINTQ